MSSNFTDGGETIYKQCKHMPAAFIWYLTVQFINFFLGILANITVLWLIHKNKGDSSTSDIYIPHLAMLDLSFSLIPPLEVTNLIFLYNRITKHVLDFFYGLKYASTLFLCCISLDCYLAVVHPLTFMKLKDSRHRAVLVTVVWLIILAYAAARCVGEIPYLYYVCTWMSLGVFAFIVFCNVSMLWALHQSGPGRDEMHPVKKKAFQSVLIILAIIVCNHLPVVVVLQFENHFSAEVFKCYVKFVAYGFVYISSTTQPLLYLFKQKKLQNLHCC